MSNNMDRMSKKIIILFSHNIPSLKFLSITIVNTELENKILQVINFFFTFLKERYCGFIQWHLYECYMLISNNYLRTYYKNQNLLYRHFDMGQ